LNLGGVHGHPCGRDYVSQVRDRCDTERALGTLDDETVLSEHGEDGAEVA
jgi:hypothetical protein